MHYRELPRHIRTLATLEESDAPVVSCYLNLAEGEAGYRAVLEERLDLLAKVLGGDAAGWPEATNRIRAFLHGGVVPRTRGVAIFARGRERPFFLPLEFRLDLPNWISVDSVPDLYHLIELSEGRHRYIIVHFGKGTTRILTVHLDAVTENLWRERLEVRLRDARGWIREHYQNHQWQGTELLVSEQIRILDDLLPPLGPGTLVLAGNSRAVQQFRDALPRRLAARLVDHGRTSRKSTANDVVPAILQAVSEAAKRESPGIVERLCTQLVTHGLAAVGPRATVEALAQGRADALVLEDTRGLGPGWVCAACGTIEVDCPAPRACRGCGQKQMRQLNVREELIRTAGQTDCRIELVEESDLLRRFGGVGCLLRFLEPETNYLWAA